MNLKGLVKRPTPKIARSKSHPPKGNPISPSSLSLRFAPPLSSLQTSSFFLLLLLILILFSPFMSFLWVGLQLFSFLVLWGFAGAAAAAASSPWEPAAGTRRSMLRALGGGGGDDFPDVAVELNSSNFDAVLRQSPARFAVVEFFAHWCPACRNYKPQYDKVARLFNGANAVHPGIVVMTRVDCADKMNIKLCDRFSVSHYPMLLWGPPEAFVSGAWNPKKEPKEIQPIDDGRTAEHLLNWINKRLNSTFGLDDEKYENENSLPHNASDPEQIARAIYDVEEATSEAFDIILAHKMIKPETQVPLIKFFQLIVAYHPSRRCRRGSAEILANFDDLWPLNSSSTSMNDMGAPHEKDALKSLQICGKEVPRGYWIFCRGNNKNTRGFSCGLWVLFHSLSVRVRDGESDWAFKTICDFIHNFFPCDECRQHFYEMYSRISTPLNTTRDVALWFWNTHNRVNERLMKTEKALGTGDPKFPKMIWPPKQLCSSCYRSPSRIKDSTPQIDWNEDEVYSFLVGYYGKQLVSSYRDEKDANKGNGDLVTDDIAASTNAVAVPMGAALGIALASCTFGALACFWRAQQKNRKQRKRTPDMRL